MLNWEIKLHEIFWKFQRSFSFCFLVTMFFWIKKHLSNIKDEVKAFIYMIAIKSSSRASQKNMFNTAEKFWKHFYLAKVSVDTFFPKKYSKLIKNGLLGKYLQENELRVWIQDQCERSLSRIRSKIVNSSEK